MMVYFYAYLSAGAVVALALMARYQLSVYDANIVAAAALSDCAVLYTEDMQDGLNLKLPGSAGTNSLVIRNPFKP
jgi:predicted nucleic acid-binding protein